MYFICKECKRQISIMKYDVPFWEKLGFVCHNCYTIVSSHTRNPKLENKTTVFTVSGKALGDFINFTSIKNYYPQDNPDEKVIFLTDWLSYDDIIRIYNPGKIFWSNIAADPYDCLTDRYIVMNKEKAYWYNMMNEVRNYASQNRFPILPFPISINPCMIPKEKYFVVHFRNIHDIKKGTDKNINKFQAKEIMDICLSTGATFVLIGNDEIYDEELLEWCNDKVLNLKHKLTLSQIRYVIKHAQGYVGSDSGLAHLAGTVNQDIFLFNQVIGWEPVTINSDVQGLQKREMTQENINTYLTKFIKNRM